MATYTITPKIWDESKDCIAEVSGGGSGESGTSLVCSCTFDDDNHYTYTFDGWYELGEKISDSQTDSFVVGDANRTIYARGHRTAKQYTITPEGSEKDYITSVTSPFTATYKDWVTVSCTIFEDTSEYEYAFLGWYNNGVRVSSSQDYEFSCTENVTLTAKAIRSDVVYEVVVSTNGSIGMHDDESTTLSIPFNVTYTISDNKINFIQDEGSEHEEIIESVVVRKPLDTNMCVYDKKATWTQESGPIELSGPVISNMDIRGVFMKHSGILCAIKKRFRFCLCNFKK